VLLTDFHNSIIVNFMKINGDQRFDLKFLKVDVEIEDIVLKGGDDFMFDSWIIDLFIRCLC